MGGGPLFESVRTVLLASNPGWQRLRSAARAALTVAGAYFTADGVARLAGQAMTIALRGGGGRDAQLADLLENLSPSAAPGILLDQSRGHDPTAQQLRTLVGPVAVWPGTRARRTRGVSAAVGALAYCVRAIAASPQAYADCAATHLVAGHARGVARRFAGEAWQRHDDCAGDSALPALPPPAAGRRTHDLLPGQRYAVRLTLFGDSPGGT